MRLSYPSKLKFNLKNCISISISDIYCALLNIKLKTQLRLMRIRLHLLLKIKTEPGLWRVNGTVTINVKIEQGSFKPCTKN